MQVKEQKSILQTCIMYLKLSVVISSRVIVRLYPEIRIKPFHLRTKQPANFKISQSIFITREKIMRALPKRGFWAGPMENPADQKRRTYRSKDFVSCCFWTSSSWKPFILVSFSFLHPRHILKSPLLLIWPFYLGLGVEKKTSLRSL